MRSTEFVAQDFVAKLVILFRIAPFYFVGYRS